MEHTKAVHQALSFTPNFPFSVLRITEGEYEELIYCHWHPMVEIILVESGQIELEIDQRIYTLNQGDIAFVNPDEIHYGRAVNESFCRVLAFVFDWSVFPVWQESTYYHRYIEPLKDLGYSLESILYASHSLDHNHLLQNLLHLMYQEYTLQPIHYQDSICSILMQLLVELYRNHLVEQQVSQRNENQTLHLIKEALRLIEKRYQKKIHFPDIAAKLSMSEDYFYKIFKRTTGQTPLHYLRHIRIQHAKNLLRSSSNSISRIGEEVGYDSTSYFIKQFHQATGMTPLQYRRHSN